MKNREPSEGLLRTSISSTNYNGFNDRAPCTNLHKGRQEYQ